MEQLQKVTDPRTGYSFVTDDPEAGVQGSGWFTAIKNKPSLAELEVGTISVPAALAEGPCLFIKDGRFLAVKPTPDGEFAWREPLSRGDRRPIHDTGTIGDAISAVSGWFA